MNRVTLNRQLAQLHDQYGRLITGVRFGQSPDRMDKQTLAAAIAFCQQMVTAPQGGLETHELTPSLRLCLHQGRVWQVERWFGSQIEAYRFYRWAIGPCALVSYPQTTAKGWKVSCWQVPAGSLGKVLGAELLARPSGQVTRLEASNRRSRGLGAQGQPHRKGAALAGGTANF